MSSKSLFISLIALCLIGYQSTFAQHKSEIADVTVYLDGAEVTRTTSVSLKPGKSEIKLNQLSPQINESSIQVAGLKNASILSINYGINYLSKQKKADSIEILEQKIKGFELEKAIQSQLIFGYNEEISLIQSNKRLGNETETVNLEKLKAFAKYYRERITNLRREINESNTKIEEANEQITNLKRQLAEYNNDEKVETGEIILKLHSEVSTNIKLVVTYNVNNAGWFPIYDLKAETINTPLSLEYKAHVFQNTGEDWDDVKIALSTSDPNTNNQKPYVNPKYLNFVSRNYTSQRATKSYNYKYNPLVKTVSGVVTSSSDGLPLPGVNVVETGTTNGTVTDFDGNYSLKTSKGETLSFSYVGFQTEKLPIHSSIMNLSMTEDSSQLDEVVVTGYSSKAKSNASVLATLQGQVSGLQIGHQSGQPGANALVQLRGVSSINGNSEPLIIVDGAPVGSDYLQTIKEDDIISMEVLKDAGSTAIYGSKGSNGVIVISTNGKRKNDLGIVIDQGISNTRFEIEKSYSIPSNSDVTVIEIDQFSVPASYSYFASPLLNENVFLTAKIGNWEQYNLLPAEANIYFEGSYSGKTSINPSATTDSLIVSLGVDPNIAVKRTQLKNFKKSSFIGNNRLVYNGFEIEVKNNKASDIKLKLVDRIPISQNKDIKIDDIEHDATDFDEEKGLLTWTIALKPGENTSKNLSYSVKFPKYKRINL